MSLIFENDPGSIKVKSRWTSKANLGQRPFVPRLLHDDTHTDPTDCFTSTTKVHSNSHVSAISAVLSFM